MIFTRLRPLLPSGGLQNEQSIIEDFKKSKRVEKYRIGEKAVYIPAGFSWKYLLKEDIQLVRKGKWLIQSENGVAPFSMEAPALRLGAVFHGSTGPAPPASGRRVCSGTGKGKERGKGPCPDKLDHVEQGHFIKAQCMI